MKLERDSFAVDLGFVWSAIGTVAIIVVFAYMNFETKAEASRDTEVTNQQIVDLRQDLREMSKKLDMILANQRDRR